MKIETFHVTREYNNRSLVDVVSILTGLSKNRAKKLIDARSVYVNEKRVWIASHKLHSGDTIKIYQEEGSRDEKKVSIEDILYQDEHFLVLNKPPGVTSNGEKSCESYLRKLLKTQSILAVHRLDKDTTGCLLFAFGREAFDKMVETFKEKSVKKKYHVLVVGEYRGGDKTINTLIDGKEAVTHLHCLKVVGGISYLEVDIETGRKHQIRKHLHSIGYPVLGDKEYTSKRSTAELHRAVLRQMLHASQLQFKDPYTLQEVRVCATLPGDFKSLLQKF